MLNRNEPDAKNIIWFDCPSHFCFHFANSWDEMNEKGETVVVLFAVIYPDLDMDFQNHEHYVLCDDKGQLFQRMEFNLTTKQMTTKNLIENLNIEFPNLSQPFFGYKSRYCYLPAHDLTPKQPTH